MRRGLWYFWARVTDIFFYRWSYWYYQLIFLLFEMTCFTSTIHAAFLLTRTVCVVGGGRKLPPLPPADQDNGAAEQHNDEW